MNTDERAQVRLLLDHLADECRSNASSLITTMFADRSAKGCLQSGDTIKAAIRIIEEVTGEFVKQAAASVSNVAMDTEAFGIVTTELEIVLNAFGPEIERTIAVAAGGGVGGVLSQRLADEAEQLHAKAQKRVRRLLEIQRFSFKRSAADREMAIQQIVSRAVVSTDIIDIMRAAGIESPDISILSDAFLAEVRDNPQKNLAIEALRKLINGEVKARSKANVTQSRAFTERLESAIARYHANALTTAEVLDELIRLAKEIREARQRGEESGLSDEEVAFYDALAENESAREAMGEPALRVIAHELVGLVRENATVDWIHRTSTRANIRRLVKRLLRKYGYPPDLQDEAVQTVLQQAEALAAEWA